MPQRQQLSLAPTHLQSALFLQNSECWTELSAVLRKWSPMLTAQRALPVVQVRPGLVQPWQVPVPWPWLAQALALFLAQVRVQGQEAEQVAYSAREQSQAED